MKMIESWSIELGKAIGKFFLNPLFYWSFIFLFLIGYARIKLERVNFGTKVFNLFSEWKNTWLFSISYGLFISLICLGVGVVFSVETLVLMSAIIILLSLTFKVSLLSPSYTVGVTFIVLLFLPILLSEQQWVDANLFTNINFTGLTIILALFIFAEAIMLIRIKRNETLPSLTLSNRGSWIGQHHVKKLALIPFLTLVPTGAITSIAPFWPYIPLGSEETYSLIAVPFLIGFDYKVIGSLPQTVAKHLGKQTFLLGFLVLVLAIGSIYVSPLSLAAIIIAIIGKEFINYKFRTKDKEQSPYFYQEENGLRILSMIPGTPATRLQIRVGEIIIKVNERTISNVEDFYYALQEKGAHFKLEVMDDKGEIRFIQGAMYEGDHHELGLIFTDSPFREKNQHEKQEVV